MDLNELVQAITREVLKQINGDADKECVMILENRNCNLVGSVLEHLGEDVEVLYLDDDPAGKSPARYILPTLSCGRMADLAAGRTSEPIATEVLRLLLSGLEVETFEFEYKSYGETAPEALYSLYESYEATLATFGLTAFTRKQADTVRLRKGLVTERDVIQAQQDGATALRVPVNANITPLAVECAKNLNVKLLKR